MNAMAIEYLQENLPESREQNIPAGSNKNPVSLLFE